MCQESLEVFDRNLDKLFVLNAELNQKIELNNRYNDSVSSSSPVSISIYNCSYKHSSRLSCLSKTAKTQ